MKNLQRLEEEVESLKGHEEITERPQRGHKETKKLS
jgi:hypothetical protein